MRVVYALLILSATVLAQGRELHWDALSVEARLGDDGRLHVEETQRMVFTGEWNGGERTFDIRPRQRIDFEGMSRIDPQSGAEIPMQQGSLSSVDQWDWAGKNVLRWRARNASDPPFDNTTITYVLRYAMSNVLLQEDDRYILDHDFAFSKREGSIERFDLELTLDPAWQTFGELQKTWSAGPIPPGRSFVLRVPLRYVGSGSPVADGGLTKEARLMLAALVAIPLLLLAYALFREKLLGRLDPPPGEITRAWLQQNLLRERAEVIGAMWDENVGAPEVSATLARLVAEGKLESTVRSGEMHLTLLSREGLDDYEAALIDGLFFGGEKTSTAKIREHYENSGFNPASIIATGLAARVQERLPQGEKAKPGKLLPTLMFFAAVAAFAWAVKTHSDYLQESIFIFFGGLFVSIFTTIAPNSWRVRKLAGIRSALASMIPAALVLGGVGFVVWRSASLGKPDLPMEMQLALTLFALWLGATAVFALRSRESREAIAHIKMLTSARDYFRRELGKERPAIDDSWYPYVLAFGLNAEVERWFRAFPGASRARSTTMSTSSSRFTSSSSPSSSPSWTGGGGAFGGAGASGAWAVAAGTMAAGVAAPSSSSSGSSSSSSSSSGGSSGGGGGGGW